MHSVCAWQAQKLTLNYEAFLLRFLSSRSHSNGQSTSASLQYRYYYHLFTNNRNLLRLALNTASPLDAWDTMAPFLLNITVKLHSGIQLETDMFDRKPGT